MCRFPNWDHSGTSVNYSEPSIADQLDAIPDEVLFTEPTDLYEEDK